jgi:hypothetical protein
MEALVIVIIGVTLGLNDVMARGRSRRFWTGGSGDVTTLFEIIENACDGFAGRAYEFSQPFVRQ